MILGLNLIVTMIWLAAMWHIRRAIRLTERLQPQERRCAAGLSLSVIIPARNEEKGIAAALASVLGQTGVNMEVIVVNDHSTDSTGLIVDRIAAGDRRVKSIHDPLLRPGWLGKTNAMQHGSRIASGRYLLFTDADIVHEPGCFQAALDELNRGDYDFLTLVPRFRWLGFWENTVVPFMSVGFAAFFSPTLEDPRSPQALGVGAFLLVRGDAYRRLGGHEGVRDSAVDDISLARHLKAGGCRVGARLAPECLSVRMYSGGKEAFFGAVKGLLPSLGPAALFLAPPVVLLGMALFWTGIATLAIGIPDGNPSLVLFGALTYTLPLLAVIAAGDLVEYRRRYVWLYPLGILLLSGSMVVAAYYKLIKQSILWRGREIDLRSPSLEESIALAADGSDPQEPRFDLTRQG